MTYHLAQVNVADAVARLDAPELAGFVALLDPLDGAARTVPGFVWRPRSPEVTDEELAVFGDPMLMIANFSVWESVEALREYVYGADHRAAMRQRAGWFHPPAAASDACWWLPAGTRPTAAGAHARLEHLRAHGPTPDAFPLGTPFPLPDRPWDVPPPEGQRPLSAGRP